MKLLHTARHATEAHLIRGYLESQGIAALVRGEFLSGGIGELPADVCQVWVAIDHDAERAQGLLRQFLNGEASRTHAHKRWHCRQCNEDIEGQFTNCWRCGADQPDK